MSLIEELKNVAEPPKPPTKTAVSAYLTDRQTERLESLASRAGLSHSKTIGRLVDLFFEQEHKKPDGG